MPPLSLAIACCYSCCYLRLSLDYWLFFSFDPYKLNALLLLCSIEGESSYKFLLGLLLVLSCRPLPYGITSCYSNANMSFELCWFWPLRLSMRGSCFTCRSFYYRRGFICNWNGCSGRSWIFFFKYDYCYLGYWFYTICLPKLVRSWEALKREFPLGCWLDEKSSDLWT